MLCYVNQTLTSLCVIDNVVERMFAVLEDIRLRVESLQQERVTDRLLLQRLLSKDSDADDVVLPDGLTLPCRSQSEVDKLADMVAHGELKGQLVSVSVVCLLLSISVVQWLLVSDDG